MATPNKEKKTSSKLFGFAKKKSKATDKFSDHSEVGILKKYYKPHDASKHVTLQHVKPWNEYAAHLAPSDDEASKKLFDANETLNEKISLWYGDITTLKIDAIVNSASPDLIQLGDVGLAVHTAAGPELSAKCASIRSCPIGEALLTKGYKLPARYIIHTVAPRGQFGQMLRRCYRNCLEIARQNKIRTIAFPCLATLFCGFNVTEATPIAISSVREWLLEKDNKNHIDRIIFSVITDNNRLVYEQNLLYYFPVDLPETVPYEISQDPYALSLFEKAIKEGKEKDRVIRVNIVGNFGQGKTTLKRRLVGQSIDGVESTNSIDVNRYKFIRTSDGKITCTYEEEDEDQEIVNRIVEIARNTELESSSLEEHDSSVGFDEVDARFLLEDEINEDSDETTVKVIDAENIPEQTTPNSGTASCNTRQLLEVIDKNPKRVLSEEELLSFSQELRITDNQKTQSNAILDIWDFGGQYVFYATHTMFHSRQAIYLLVFDLTVDLNDVINDKEFPGESGDKDMEFFARFWMNSIHSFVGNEDGSLPAVILVGTHKDVLEVGNDTTKSDYCEAYFDKLREMFEGTEVIRHIQEKEFAVNNNDPTDDAVAKLLEEILRIGEELSNTIEIPAKWLPLERTLKQKRNMKIITFEKVMQLDAENEFPLSDENQVKLFLHYHHTKGTLFYFDEEPVSNFVVLDPRYLIDAFKCIITSKRFCKKMSSIRDSWNKLTGEGKLESTLIDKVWGKDTENSFIEHKHVLLEFLKKHHIISEAAQFDENSEKARCLGWYVVPSLLKDHSNTTEVADFMSGRKQTEVRFVMLFEHSSLLQTVFSRLIAALLGKWSVVDLPTEPPKHLLFENLGAFRLNVDHAGIVEVRDKSIELLVLSLCPSKDIDSVVADRFRRYCEAVVVHEFRFLRSKAENMKKPFKQACRCNHETHGMYGSKVVENISVLTGTELIPCPDLMKHEICSEKAVCEWFLKDQVRTSHQDKDLTEKELSKVAQSVGQNWQLLGIELGLTQVQIDQVSSNNDTMARKIFNMLKKWNSQNKGHSNMSNLVQAMNNIKSLTVDWDEIRNICDSND